MRKERRAPLSIMPMAERMAKPRRSVMPHPFGSCLRGRGSASPGEAVRPGSSAPRAAAPQRAKIPYAAALAGQPYAAAPAATAAGATTLPRSPVKL